MADERSSLLTLELVLAWATKHKQKLLIGLVAVGVVAIALGAWRAHNLRARRIAEEELSKLRPTISAQGEVVPVPASALLRIADSYPRTKAGARARLMAAGALFNEGRFAEAKIQFDRFIRDYPQSPFRPDALYGSAASLAAQGKAAEAIPLLNQIVERYPDTAVATRAKLTLAKLLAAQNQLERARTLLEQVARAAGETVLGYQAQLALEQLGMPETRAASHMPPDTGHVRPGPGPASGAN
ncbi:MAG: tetratricopeptide repeat protein [Verrucomicrobiae bacterium]|nr:tetratricopeptide repeat protein [Verrucomicrobiae bacterium]